jgi:hypothetical protein
VLTDGSKLSDKAVKLMDALLTLFYVAPGYPVPMYAQAALLAYVPPEQFKKDSEAYGEKILATAAKRAAVGSVDMCVAHATIDSVSTAIVKVAARTCWRCLALWYHNRALPTAWIRPCNRPRTSAIH